MDLKLGDWVTTGIGGDGIVTRIAKDQSWADVTWKFGAKTHSKRMPTSSLIVQHSIIRGEYMITDMEREKEIKDTELTESAQATAGGRITQEQAYGTDCRGGCE